MTKLPAGNEEEEEKEVEEEEVEEKEEEKEEEEVKEEEKEEEPTHLPGRFGGQGNQGMPHPLSSSSSSSLSSLPLEIFSQRTSLTHTKKMCKLHCTLHSSRLTRSHRMTHCGLRSRCELQRSLNLISCTLVLALVPAQLSKLLKPKNS